VKVLEFRTRGGKAVVHVGASSEFLDTDDPGVAGDVLGSLQGTVAWLEWIEAPRGKGREFLSEILAALEDMGVDVVGAQVVPVGVSEDDPAVKRLAAFYERLGFEHAPHLAPYSDWPVMLHFLHT